jgi:hypothetical protein
MRSDRKSRGATKPAQIAQPVPAKQPALNIRPHFVALAAIWALVLIAYSNSFSAGLIFDNNPIIMQDPRIRAVTSENLHQIWRGEYWYTQVGNGLYRPLTTMSYLFNYAVLGNQDRPAGYHVVNFALHAINASLLYLLGLAIFGRKVAPALILALIWAVHPVLTESVTNVVGRADLLAGLGMLGALLCYRQGWYAAAAIACAGGMFSKESAIVIPLVVIVYDLCFPPDRPLTKRLWGYAALVAPCLLYFAVRPPLYPLRIAFTDNPLVGASFMAARLTALKVIGTYIWLLLFPVSLSSDYSFNAIPLSTVGDWRLIVSVAALAGVIALAVYGWRRDRRWFFFIALAAIGLAPVANVAKLIGTVMAERFLYIPAMGFAGCLVLAGLAVKGFTDHKRRWSVPLLPMLAGLIIVAFAARTWARNADWADNRSMWASLVKSVPDSWKAHAFFYGKTLDDSVEHVGIALAIVNDLPDSLSTSVPYINAGKAYSEKGLSVAKASPGEAATWYRRSLDVLLRGERIMKTSGENRFELYEQLGITYTRLGDFTNAIRALNGALSMTTTENLTRELSGAYLQSGDTHRAEVTLWEGLLADPGNQHFSTWLVDMYQHTNPGSCALQQQPGGWALNPGCPLVHDQVCSASANVVRTFRERRQDAQAAELRNTGVTQFGCPAALF